MLAGQARRGTGEERELRARLARAGAELERTRTEEEMVRREAGLLDRQLTDSRDEEAAQQVSNETLASLSLMFVQTQLARLEGDTVRLREQVDSLKKREMELQAILDNWDGRQRKAAHKTTQNNLFFSITGSKSTSELGGQPNSEPGSPSSSLPSSQSSSQLPHSSLVTVISWLTRQLRQLADQADLTKEMKSKHLPGEGGEQGPGEGGEQWPGKGGEQGPGQLLRAVAALRTGLTGRGLCRLCRGQQPCLTTRLVF